MVFTDDPTLIGGSAARAEEAAVLAAALHLWSDDLAQAAACLKGLESSRAALVQCATLRRRGDFDTAKNWSRLAGRPAFGEDLRTAAMTLYWEREDTLSKRLHLSLRSTDGWHPETLVEWAEHHHRGEDAWTALTEPLERIQELELALMAHDSYRAVLGEDV